MLKRRHFDDEHHMFQDTVKRWVAEALPPHADAWRAQGMVSREIWKEAGAQGFLCMFADEAYGGMGLDDFRFDQILAEEIGAREGGFFLGLHNRVVAPYLQQFATDAQKARFMPGVVSGDTVLAIAMTEPGTGSDVSGIRTRAERKGDRWVLNGSKTYISNGILSDLIVVAARTDPDNPRALGLFLVETGMPGFSRGKQLKKLGLHSQDTAELFFEDVELDEMHVLGDPTKGFVYMMHNLAEERLLGASTFMGRCNRAFEITMDFITERKAFGKPIGQFQNSRFKMAEMRTEIDAAQSFLDHCVMEHVDGNLTPELAAEVKLFTSEVEGRVVDTCLQLHGGAGFIEEYEISRLYADARISRIYAGTSEIMKEIIGRGLGLDDRKPKA